jgi:hypothetical protein
MPSSMISALVIPYTRTHVVITHGSLYMPGYTRGNTKEHTETRTSCIERTYKNLKDDLPISQPFVAYITVFIDTDMVTSHPRPH